MPTTRRPAPSRTLCSPIAACSNLRSLTLRGAPWSDYTKVLDAVCSTRIREFTCHARGEAGVVRFLERQTELEQVDLEAQSFDFESLSPLAARKLWSFTGCLTTAAAIVPSRPIRRLTLTSDLANDATVRAVEKLSLGLGDVEALDIRMGVLRNPMSWSILESVFISLRGLRFLGVCSLDCARVSPSGCLKPSNNCLWYRHRRLCQIRRTRSARARQSPWTKLRITHPGHHLSFCVEA